MSNFRISLEEFSSELASEWHLERNSFVSPSNVGKSSSTNFWWRCKAGHEWQATVAARSFAKQGCPYCTGRLPTDTYNLWVLHPKTANQWHKTLNGDLTPQEVLPKSNRNVWWKCQKGHEWQARVANRTSVNKSGCPYCSGQKVDDFSNFAALHPEISKEWHPIKNKPHLPKDFSEFSGKRFWWKCKKGHEWRAQIGQRSQGNNCPYCWKHTSIPEFRLLAELGFIFSDVQRRKKFNRQEIDIYIPDYSIGIEYDGSYWHRGQESRDRKKQKILASIGITLFRVREDPLKEISPFDVLAGSRVLKKFASSEKYVGSFGYR